MLRAARQALQRGLVDLALPQRCASCKVPTASDPLCTACRARLPEAPAAQHESFPHDPLLSALDGVVAATSYSGEVERWVHAFKYPGRGVAGADPAAIALVRALIGEAGEAASAEAAVADAIVPVPLHATRLAARGFNPAALLALELARTRRVPLETRLLLRRRDTPSQTGLDRRGRVRNVAGAFCCAREAPRHIWLVDDVVTTGATIAECARVLRRAGARKVVAVCVARTPL